MVKQDSRKNQRKKKEKIKTRKRKKRQMENNPTIRVNEGDERRKIRWRDEI